MPLIFDKISQHARHQVIEESGRPPEFFQDSPPSDGKLTVFVCRQSMLGVLREMLHVGLDPSFVPPSTAVSNDHAVPLAMLSYGNPMALPLLDLLLAKGANPNISIGAKRGDTLLSPMHAAAGDATALQRLVAAGGSIKAVDANGWTVVDQWLHFSKEFLNTSEKILPSLEMIVQSGWDPLDRLQGGKAFLPKCWSHGQLRDCLPRLFGLGFDPRQEDGPGKSQGTSLKVLAEMVDPQSRQFSLAAWVLTHCQAMDLQDASSPGGNPNPRPRL